MKYFILLLTFLTFSLSAQDQKKTLCSNTLNVAGDEKMNTKQLFMSMRSEKKDKNTSSLRMNENLSVMNFPLRIGVISKDGKVDSTLKKRIEKSIANLNTGFDPVGLNFTIDKIEGIKSDLLIEDLTEDSYTPYNTFSDEHDHDDMISVYVFDYDPYLCTVTPTTIRCSRTGGFSYILSERTNNVVLSAFDIEDDKILVHEISHFFGLYHTFEEAQFGKDDFEGDCNVLGDCLCDTPPDPGPAFEVYVNYSTCSMMGFLNESNYSYNPLINNYMTYFKPCYLTPYSFTQGQVDYLRYSAMSEFRVAFSK